MENIITFCFIYNANMLSHTLQFFYHHKINCCHPTLLSLFCQAFLSCCRLSHAPFMSIPFILIPHAPFPTAQPPGPGGQDKPSTRVPPIANSSSKSYQMG